MFFTLSGQARYRPESAMNPRAVIAMIFFIVILLEAGFRLKTNLAQGFSLKNAFLYGLLVASLANVFANSKRNPAIVKKIYIAFLLLTIYSAVTVFYSPEMGGFRQYNAVGAAIIVKTLLLDSLMALLVFSAALPRSTNYLRLIRWMVIVLGLLSGLVLVEVWVPGAEFYGYATLERRPRGPLGEPNQTAAVFALMLPVAIALLVRARGVMRVLCGGAAVMLVAALVLTGSRGGMVATTVGMAFFLVAARKELRFSSQVALISALPLAFMLGWALLPDHYQTLIEQRLLSLGNVQVDAERTSAGRTMLWTIGLEAWKRSPILGHGWGFYREASGSATHNEYLLYLVDTGVIGFVLYVSIWTFVIRLLHLARQSGRGDGLVLASFQAGVLGLMVAIFFVNLILPWLIVWSVVGLMLAESARILTLAESQPFTRKLVPLEHLVGRPAWRP